MSQSIKAFPWPYKRRASILNIRAMLSMETYLITVIYLGSSFYLITLTLYDVPAPLELSMVLVLLHHLCTVQIPPGHNRWN